MQVFHVCVPESVRFPGGWEELGCIELHLLTLVADHLVEGNYTSDTNVFSFYIKMTSASGSV